MPDTSSSENLPGIDPSVDQEDSRIHWTGLLIFLVTLTATLTFYFLKQDGSLYFEVAYALAASILLSTVLWQACEPFAEAAQWFGDYWRIPGSVRGATLDAVASSMPELFTGLFFVLVAIWGDRSLSERLQHSTDGYGSTIATCAGSAIYNLILIPALCCLALPMVGNRPKELNVETEVLRRDGNWVLVTQFGLLILLALPELHWWMAVLGLLGYLGYVIHLALATHWHRQRLKREEAAGQGGAALETEDDIPEHAIVLFNVAAVRLTAISSILVLLGSTIVAASACYFLVEITNELSGILGIPAFFVSVILVASVSSVPDTLLSIGAARRGDDAGAISNVFGSNIFDICVGMSLPLLVCCYLNDWEPIQLVGKNAETMSGVTGLRILLFVMTSIVMFLFWKNRKVTVRMSWFFCLLYCLFIAYAVVGGLGLFPV